MTADIIKEWADRRTLRHWVGDGVILTAMALFSASAYFNAKFNASLATSPDMQAVMAVTGVAIAAMLALITLGKRILPKAERKGITIKLWLMVMALAAWEVWSAMGHIGTNRGDAVGSRTNEQVVYRNAVASKAADEAALKTLRVVPPAGSIRSQMADYERRPWFAGTNNCAAPGGMQSACRRYLALAGDHAIAVERAKLDKRIADASAVIASGSGSVHNSADVQSETGSRVLGLVGIRASSTDLAKAMPVFLAIVLLLAGWWGLELGLVIRGVKLEGEAPDAKPTATVHHITPDLKSDDRIHLLTKRLGDMAKAQAA